MLFSDAPIYKNVSIAVLDHFSRLWLRPARERETAAGGDLNAPMVFRVFALIDGELAGGITYLVQGKDGRVPDRLPVGVAGDAADAEPAAMVGAAQDIVAAIDELPGVKSVRVKKLSVEIEFEDE